MIYYKKQDIEKFIKSKNGNYIVTSYIAYLIGILTALLILVVVTRTIYLTFWYPNIKLSMLDHLSGIASLIGSIGILAWGKSFDVKSINSKENEIPNTQDSKENNASETITVD